MWARAARWLDGSRAHPPTQSESSRMYYKLVFNTLDHNIERYIDWLPAGWLISRLISRERRLSLQHRAAINSASVLQRRDDALTHTQANIALAAKARHGKNISIYLLQFKNTNFSPAARVCIS